MKRADLVRQGAELLINAENSVEQALCEVASLTGQLSRLRLEANLSIVVGQEAMDALVESITLLSNARGAMVKAHGHLDGVKNQLGCRTVAVGTQEKPPTDTNTAHNDFKIVAVNRSAA